MRSLAESISQLWREARGNLVGGLAAALVLALLGVVYSILGIWGSVVAAIVVAILLGGWWLFLRRWSRRSKSQPSASQHLKDRLMMLVKEMEKSPLADAIEIENVIAKSFDGREQLLRPVRLHLQSILSRAKKSKDTLPQVVILRVANSFLASMTKAQESIAEIGSALLENLDSRLVDTIVLADFSTPITRILWRLAERYPKQLGSVQVSLIASERHFISSQDTTRWGKLLNQKEVARFYHLEAPVPFSKCEALFGRLQRDGGCNVILLGAERVYPEGTAVVFPGISAVARMALEHGLTVFVVAETYKVQPRQQDEKYGIGSDVEGAPVELGYVEMSPRVRLITEHGIHSMAGSDHLQNVRTVKSLKCCTRFWRNAVEGRRYPIGVIFDLDGTLIDSEAIHKSLYQKVAESVGYHLTDEEYRLQLRGQTDTEIFRYVLQRVGGSIQAADLVTRKQEAFLKHITHGRGIPPMRGAVRFINDLAEQGFLLAVATSATSEEANLVLRGLGVIDRLAFVRSAESVSVGKPAPEIYQRTVRDLGLLPSECLVYEDAIPGIRSALAAGMRVVAVGDVEDQTFVESGAMLVIRDFDGHNLPEIPLELSI